MKPNVRLGIVAALCLVGAFLALSLLFQHHGEALGTSTVSTLCGGEDAGCIGVNQSAYAEVAGLPWAAIGLVFYLALIALAVIAMVVGDEVKAIAAGTAFALFAAALVIDLGLFAIQAFRIHAFCKLCLATYVLNALSLAALWPMRRGLAAARAALATPPLRVAVAGWILTVAASAVGVAGMEAALKEREESRAANILGPMPGSSPALSVSTPDPAPTPDNSVTPALPTSGGAPDVKRYQEQLKAAQDELKRLQETLDDPQKYERYLIDKNLKQFAKAPLSTVDLKNAPFAGPADAPIKIAIYSDFLCPFCRQIAQGFHSYLPNTANRVAVYYKFFPLDTCNPGYAQQPIHPGACWLAWGGACAQEQGKFWPYHDRVFFTDPPKTAPDQASTVKLARELGLDPKAFETCLTSPRVRERVLADINEGPKAGFNGTPTLFINKRRLPHTSVTLQAIDEESRRLGLGPMPVEPEGHAGH